MAANVFANSPIPAVNVACVPQRSPLRYPAFRAAGLPVGSGVVESACGTVAGRLKRGGMRWVVERGANPVLTLRCWWLDGRHDGFFKARARPPPMALAA